MTSYFDPMYGEIQLDEMILDLVDTCPELKRLRFIGMMNFKSLRMLALTSISRLEHTLGLAYLTQVCVSSNAHLRTKMPDFLVAALYHDVNCGSFGHSVEWAINRHFSYNHEEKASWVELDSTLEGLHDKPTFLEHDGLHRYGFGKKYGIDFANVNKIINGDSSYLINNSGIDLDNVDNVLRMAHYLGKLKNKSLGLEIVSRLRVEENRNNFVTDDEGIKLVDEWRQIRSDVYRSFIYSSEYMGFEFLLFELIKEYSRFVNAQEVSSVFHYTDENLLWSFYNDWKNSDSRISKFAKRLLLQDLPHCHGILRVNEFQRKNYFEQNDTLSEIAHSLSQTLATSKLASRFKDHSLFAHLTTDDRKTSRAVSVLSDQRGKLEQVVLGRDERYLLIAILSDIGSAQATLDAFVMEQAAAVMKNFGVEQIECFSGAHYSPRSSQIQLI